MQVESSHINDISWDGGTLTVQFRDGGMYQYFDVPFGTYNEFLAAESKGRFFKENIKGVFEFGKV